MKTAWWFRCTAVTAIGIITAIAAWSVTAICTGVMATVFATVIGTGAAIGIERATSRATTSIFHPAGLTRGAGFFSAYAAAPGAAGRYCARVSAWKRQSSSTANTPVPSDRPIQTPMAPSPAEKAKA